jgi:hypothetical protein
LNSFRFAVNTANSVYVADKYESALNGLGPESEITARGKSLLKALLGGVREQEENYIDGMHAKISVLAGMDKPLSAADRTRLAQLAVHNSSKCTPEILTLKTFNLAWNECIDGTDISATNTKRRLYGLSNDCTKVLLASYLSATKEDAGVLEGDEGKGLGVCGGTWGSWGSGERYGLIA